MTEVIKSLVSNDGQRRLQIMRKGDRYTATDEVQTTDRVGELCWTPAWPSRVAGLNTDTAELAETEARARLNWLGL